MKLFLRYGYIPSDRCLLHQVFEKLHFYKHNECECQHCDLQDANQEVVRNHQSFKYHDKQLSETLYYLYHADHEYRYVVLLDSESFSQTDERINIES